MTLEIHYMKVRKLMSDKLLITPYFGKLPNYFQIWLNRLKINSNLDFLIVTDQNLYGYDLLSNNIKIVKMTLIELRGLIEDVVGKKVKLNTAYKINDYRPLFGLVFAKYVGGYSYIGTLDTDVLLGITSHFLDSNGISKFDKVNGNGHFTFWKNTDMINNLWRDNHKEFDDVPSFRLVISLNSNFAYDEYGWKFSKGISTVMERKGFNIQSDLPRADLDFNFSGFRSNRVCSEILLIDRILVNQKGIFAVDKSSKQQYEVMYVHLQKRKMDISDYLSQKEFEFQIVPNRFISIGERVTNADSVSMRKKFEKEQKKRVWKTRKHNLSSDYVILRFVMWLKLRNYK